MKLYDQLIRKTLDDLKPLTPTVRPYSAGQCWKDNGRSLLVMQRDAAYELGGSGKPSANFTCVTTSSELVGEDRVELYGKDLSALSGDVSFARVAILEVEDLGDDEEAAYRAIRNMEFVRYHVYPDGYMVRVSSESNQEQVRISKQALKKGISLGSVGNTYIQRYKAIGGVKHVRLLFFTNQAIVSELSARAKKIDEITSTLTHILDGMPTDCGHCSMKPVCDEVEGMRELHLGKKKK